MTDRNKFVTLIRLRDMMYFGVQPTLRQCGFAPQVVQELAKDGFIRLSDKRFGEEVDRYVVEGLLPAGASFILEQKTARNPLERN